MPHRVHALVFLAAALAAAVLACSGGHARQRGHGASASGEGETLSIKGSDTMVVLAQRWAEGFSTRRPGTTIQVSGGGSGTGLSALVGGTTDLATASRAIRDRERDALREGRGLEAHETRVALDAIAIYVHRDNPIGPLSMAQLARIFRGHVTRWSELGGPDRPIVLYSRENNSGTYAFFKEHVLEGFDFAAAAQTLPGTAAVIHAVSRDPNGIGYGGIGYGHGVRTVPILGEDGTPIDASLDHATTGRYPLARALYVYSAGTPRGASAELLAWITGPEGQALVAQTGFYPLPETRTETP
jgi:phosphate transport system substrate-binding protein